MEKHSEKTMARKIRALENSLNISDDYAKKLQARVRVLERQKKALIEEEKKKNERQRRSVIEGKEVALRDSLIRNMAAETERLRKMSSMVGELEMIAKDGCIPVILVDNPEKESIIEKDKRFGINGSVITINHNVGDSLAVKTLISLQPKAVIADLDENSTRMLNNADICVINPKKVSLRKYFEFFGVDRAEFERETGNMK